MPLALFVALSTAVALLTTMALAAAMALTTAMALAAAVALATTAMALATAATAMALATAALATAVALTPAAAFTALGRIVPLVRFLPLWRNLIHFFQRAADGVGPAALLDDLVQRVDQPLLVIVFTGDLFEKDLHVRRKLEILRPVQDILLGYRLAPVFFVQVVNKELHLVFLRSWK